MNLDAVRVLTHSAIRLQANSGAVVYCDPFDLVDAPHDASVVLITHNHYDHLSPEDYKKVANETTIVIAPSTIEQDVAALDAARVILLDAGDSTEVCGVAVSAVPAYNVEPERLQFHSQENKWLGYLVGFDGTTFYISGDTDENEDIDKVSCDVALIPIGGTYTMDPAQAAAFINTIKPAVVVPTHYGTAVGNKEDVEAFEPLVDPSIKVVRKMEWH